LPACHKVYATLVDPDRHDANRLWPCTSACLRLSPTRNAKGYAYLKCLVYSEKMPSNRERNASTHFASEVRGNPKLRRSLSLTQICAIDNGGPATGSRRRDHDGPETGSSAQRQLQAHLEAPLGEVASAPPLVGPCHRSPVGSAPPRLAWISPIGEGA